MSSMCTILLQNCLTDLLFHRNCRLTDLLFHRNCRLTDLLFHRNCRLAQFSLNLWQCQVCRSSLLSGQNVRWLWRVCRRDRQTDRRQTITLCFLLDTASVITEAGSERPDTFLVTQQTKHHAIPQAIIWPRRVSALDILQFLVAIDYATRTFKLQNRRKHTHCRFQVRSVWKMQRLLEEHCYFYVPIYQTTKQAV